MRLLVRRPEAAEALRALGAELAPGDITDPDSLKSALSGVDAVVHIAAFFRGATLEQMQRVNEEGTELLARLALEAGVRRFVFCSTNRVYPNGLGRPARESDPIPALQTPYPQSLAAAYPRSKAEAERRLLALEKTDSIGLRVLRLAFVYGEGDPHLREFFSLVRDWSPERRLQMVHHADVGQALLRALTAEGIDGRIYNIADDAPMTAFELAELERLPAPDANAGTKDFDPWEMIVSTARARTELGFRPIYPSAASARDAGAL